MRSVLLLAVALSAVLWPLEAHAVGDVRRFAVIAGNDDGGRDTRPLRYAREDARKMHALLLRLGGVRPQDARLLLGASSQQFLDAVAEVEALSLAAQRRGEKTALILYYSGHAKDGALRLGDTQVPFASLRSRLAQAPADVRVGIFDACQSGQLTRRKGARKAPAFEIQATASRDAQGLVILTSSAADEDSQESDAIGGSYFSHHLASGLLGDADRSQDGRVSLAEAYAYAYERTVADTVSSLAGAQHPTYSYDFQGNGDLVLTDVVDRKEGLVFAASAPGGTWYVVDGRGFVAAEVWKPADEERRIAVQPGQYRLKRRLPDRLRVGEVTVYAGRLTAVDDARLRDAPFSDDPVKGAGSPMAGDGARMSFALGGAYQSFFDRPTRESLFPSTALLGAELTLHGFLRKDWLWGFDVGLGGGREVLRLERIPDALPYRYSNVGLGTTIAAEWPVGRFVPHAGGRLAMVMASRDFDDPVLPNQTFVTLSPGVVGGVRYRLLPSLSAGVRGRVHYLLYNVDENRSLGYWELSAQLAFEPGASPWR